MTQKQTRTYDDTGMRNLMIAVLQDAVDTITLAKKKVKYRHVIEDAQWFAEQGRDWLAVLEIGAPGESLRYWLASNTGTLNLAEQIRCDLNKIENQITRSSKEMTHAL